MNNSDIDHKFSGSIPEIYDNILVPLLFEAYTEEMLRRLPGTLTTVLETAAGSGVLTRALSEKLPSAVSLVATDLNTAMLAQAEKRGTKNAVTWKQADAMSLPFNDNSFDAVLCQYGAMFFADKSAAFAEAKRVLKPGGIFIFSVWDKIEENEFASTIVRALEAEMNLPKPGFLERTPHGYHDKKMIIADLNKAGFNKTDIDTVSKRSRASGYMLPAQGYCQGSPLKMEIESINESVEKATGIAAAAMAAKYGNGAVEGKIQAHIITAVKF